MDWNCGGRGRSAEAIAALHKAVALNPQNLRAIYHLAQEVERQGDANSEVEYQQLMQKILAAQPDNLAALLEHGASPLHRKSFAPVRLVVPILPGSERIFG